MRSGVFRAGVIYAAANVLSAGVPFLLLPILTRALTPDEYGKVVSFYMLVAISAGVAGLGLQSAVAVRWLDSAATERRRYTGTAVAMALASTAFASALMSVFGPHWVDGLDAAACALAPVVAGSIVLQGMRFAVWQSQDRPLPAAALQVSSAALNMLLSLAAVLALGLGGWGRIVGASLAGALIAAFSVFLLAHSGAVGRPDPGNTRTLLRFGVPLVPHALAGALLANADRFAVSGQMGAQALGVYGAATQLGLVINVLADAMIKAWTPAMYRLLGRKTAAGRLRVVGVAYLSVPVWISVALLLWGVYAVAGRLLLGEAYLDAIRLSIWFLMGGAVSAVYLNVAGLFFFTGKTEWISIATMSAAGIAILVAGPLASAYGADGGAATYLLAQLALLATAGLLSQRVRPMPWSRPRLAVRLLLRSARRHA